MEIVDWAERKRREVADAGAPARIAQPLALVPA
jgi:hypothetical protein